MSQQPQVSYHAHARRFLATDRLAELEGHTYNRAYWILIARQHGVSYTEIDQILGMSLRDLYRLAGRPDPAPGPWWRRLLDAVRKAA